MQLKSQPPLTQVALAPLGAGQGVQLDPHELGSVAGLPLGQIPLQGAVAPTHWSPHFRPPLQPKSHAPFVQTALPPAGAEHILHPLPQALTSLSDLHWSPQEWKAWSQRIPHEPLLQVAVPLPGVGQVLHWGPHAMGLFSGTHAVTHSW